MNLEKEYARWTVVQKIVKFLETRAVNKKRYELLNILERFLLRSANLRVKRHDAIFVDIPLNHEIYKHFLREINEKKIAYPGLAKKIAQTIQNYILSFLKNSFEKDDIIHKKENTYQYKDYQKTINPDRITVLEELAEYNQVKDVDKAIITMLIRYDCLLQRGQQWSLPRAMYKNIYKKCGIDIELFASPLNNQLSNVYASGETTMEIYDIRYGSLFPDTDSVFGSIGNSFDLNTQDVTDCVIVANPSFVIELMDQTSQLIHDWLERSNVTVIFNVADWSDADYYLQCIKSEYCLANYRLDPHTYFYESEKGTIKAPFPSHLFIMSKDNKHDWTFILEGYKNK